MAPMLIMFVEFGAKQYCAEMVFFALNGVKWFVLGNVQKWYVMNYNRNLTLELQCEVTVRIVKILNRPNLAIDQTNT